MLSGFEHPRWVPLGYENFTKMPIAPMAILVIRAPLLREKLP